MKLITLQCGNTTRIFDCSEQLKVNDVHKLIVQTFKLAEFSDYYLCCNGRKIEDLSGVQDGHVVNVCFRLVGGKGGFGSMLRAIGAQIEKTTNREACRDLSGRRLRDINEEMRLKKWISKQADQRQDKDSLKIEALERKLAIPKHEFSDAEYDKQRSVIPDKVNDAVAQGLAVAKSGVKRSTNVVKPKAKKLKLWDGLEDDLDELSDSSCDDDLNLADHEKSKPLFSEDSNNQPSTSKTNLNSNICDSNVEQGELTRTSISNDIPNDEQSESNVTT